MNNRMILPENASRLVVRKLGFADRSALRHHYRHLDPDAVRMRFFGMLSDAALDAQIDRSLAFGMVVHGCFVDGTLRAVAELSRVGGLFSREGEAAFSVESEWRHYGIATELFRRMLRTARNRGLKTLRISCLAWNQPMRALAAKFAAELKLEDGSVVGTIISPAPSTFSLFEEWAQDVQGAALAVAGFVGRRVAQV